MALKRAVVCGAGGFLGSHLVKELKKKGYWIRGVDLHRPEFCKTGADDFQLLDLRRPEDCTAALHLETGPPDEVYQFAADMGGLGHIHSQQCEIMRNNALININLTHSAAEAGVSRYFFASSVCVYRDMEAGEPELIEEQAYPAMPNNEYGWEKLYAERVALTYGQKYGLAMRIARFQNCYGPEGLWTGGREKAPAAICRKVAEVADGDAIEVWGDGTAVRNFTYVDDMVAGIHRLMQSDLAEPVNIGSPEYVTIRQLINTVAEVSGKKFEIKWIEGPVGVQARNFSSEKINSIGWQSRYSLKEGISQTYPWIEEQVRKSRCHS